MKDLTERDVAIVQESWKKVDSISEQAAELFYNRLFELDSNISSLFKGDMAEQGKKLMQMIGVAVNGLSDLSSIVPAVQQLGIRHKGYNVKEPHYDTVGQALLWTLQQGLGESFDHELKEAWTKVYTVLSSTMKDAAANA